ncbi:MAG: hypothetical protein HOL01_01610 [Planctomycetaceae bacterium]|nr:hypothetical protein [Planctomycetaceae bacterium]MBT6487566.1 hypothetical protein [Planctomycetaceae bacterium]MBT6493224.1 hypothetical protein [Planctomycetaceae bacterium]
MAATNGLTVSANDALTVINLANARNSAETNRDKRGACQMTAARKWQ